VPIVVDILLLQTISVAIASAGVFAAAVYYIIQIRHQTKVRETDLAIRMNPWMAVSGGDLTDVIAQVWSLEFKDYNDFIKKYGPFTLRKPEQKAIQTLLNYFEGVGLLLKRELMDIDFAWDLWGNSYFLIWEKLKPLVDGLRKQYGMPEAWGFFEYLYNETKKRGQRLQQSKA
jgi:hypothetical protein